MNKITNIDLIEDALERCEEYKTYHHNLLKSDMISIREYDEHVLKSYELLEKQLLRIVKERKGK